MHSSNEIIGERGLTSIITVFSREGKCRYVERAKETLKNAKMLVTTYLHVERRSVGKEKQKTSGVA